jgi:hypothetical protein
VCVNNFTPHLNLPGRGGGGGGGGDSAVQTRPGQGGGGGGYKADRRKKPYETKLREYRDVLFDLGLYYSK